ncbi:hypothetical protein RFI_21037 [Reticulomyxa filosa]|uniref:Uncharacterized protein n=1 Tax=Reticulomyxa filosa TaxID=46433 RepID=X6MRN1_RETFI|nr:hypothetical protein RFI_21037 [Reticulomyxa filosa]|eukprot:ETO16316.1 hypothetical protein RFI_21037 [Reticulomyxa filosa]
MATQSRIKKRVKSEVDDEEAKLKETIKREKDDSSEDEPEESKKNKKKKGAVSLEPESKRVRFDENVSNESTFHRFQKYAENAIEFPRVDSLVSLRVGHDSAFASVCANNKNASLNNQDKPYLVLFDAPLDFDFKVLDKCQLQLSSTSKVGSKVTLLLLQFFLILKKKH